MKNPFRYFNSSPEIIRLAIMMYIRYPLSLRQVEDVSTAATILNKTEPLPWPSGVSLRPKYSERQPFKRTPVLVWRHCHV